MFRRLAFIGTITLCMSAYSQTADEILTIIKESSPIADIINTDPRIFIDAAKATEQARREMGWNVPQREFEHFVVPLRVNNEPIDNHRPVIYAMLKDRVAGKTMEEAVLEVNHWCHEYVNYQPSDARTHSPLESMSSCIGRCGEESTFTVSALRAVGIPARQVYTPRWAHTDDNHAWVEAWVDGEWKFLGACEPEPILNLAWFNAPATRAMMMHTFVRGEYDGPEEIVTRMPEGVNINVTSTYAPVVTTTVSVVDENGNGVADADVSFRIYNYAEYYPIAEKKSDSKGKASLSTGIGDMLIWAAKDNKFGFSKVRAGDDNPVVVLNRKSGNLSAESYDWDFNPPIQGKNIAEPTKEQIEENLRRLAAEDEIRQSKLDKFMTPEEASALADKLSLPAERVKAVMHDARGNRYVLSDFLTNTPKADRERALRLLESLSEKDRADVKMQVLFDHLTTPEGDGDVYNEYVLCPRIEVESLSPWRTYIAENMPAMQSADEIIAWINGNIEIIPSWHPGAVTIHPEKALANRQANERSRDMLFVAAARTNGIPARKDQVTGQIQWRTYDNPEWHTVEWGKKVDSTITPKGKLVLTPDSANRVKNPVYYTHFTITRIADDGTPYLLEFDEDETYKSSFAKPVSLDCGDYILTTGQRLASGAVLANSTLFSIRENEETSLPLRVRHDNTAIEVIGNFNSQNRYYPLADDGTMEAEKSILATTGRGYYIIGIVSQTNEPSNHAMRDLAAVKGELESLNIPIVIMTSPGENASKFAKHQLLAGLPAQTAIGVDKDNTSLNELIANLDLPESDLPVFAIADTFNRVVFVSHGYTIGLGQKLVDILNNI